jgi:hypothetical protein
VEGAVTLNKSQGRHALRYGRWVMIEKVLEILFGCRHAHFSFPVTIRGAKRRPQAAALTGTYVVCLDCGKEFAYDWQQMKVITSPDQHREQMAELAKHAA